MAWPRGMPHSEETKQHMRDAHQGQPGRPQSEETRRKISAARQASEAAKPPKPPRVPRPRSGWKWTDEQRARFSAARKGVPISTEGRQRIAEARRREWAALSEDERTERIYRLRVRDIGTVDPRRPRARRPSGPCQSCGTHRKSLHREHIVPRWKGGTEDPENIQWFCANCHEDKTREDNRGRPGPMKGRVHSEETRAKMRDAALRRLADARTESLGLPVRYLVEPEAAA